jgi:hypothetical protein
MPLYAKCSVCMQGEPKRASLPPDQQEAARAADRMRKLRRAIRDGRTPTLRKPTPEAIPYLQSIGMLEDIIVPPVGISRAVLNKEYRKKANRRYREGFWPNVKFGKDGKPTGE